MMNWDQMHCDDIKSLNMGDLLVWNRSQVPCLFLRYTVSANRKSFYFYYLDTHGGIGLTIFDPKLKVPLTLVQKIRDCVG